MVQIPQFLGHKYHDFHGTDITIVEAIEGLFGGLFGAYLGAIAGGIAGGIAEAEQQQ